MRLNRCNRSVLKKTQRDSDAFFGNTEEDTSGMAEKSEPAAADSDKKTKALFDDPFGDDPFADGPRRTDPMPDQPSPDKDSETMTTGDFDDPFNFAPRKPAGSNTQRDQIEMQKRNARCRSSRLTRPT